ncbi:MAG: type III-A CRISPR-associated protein Cas10/Csm1 [Candidatus Hodarchaeales archaeon]
MTSFEQELINYGISLLAKHLNQSVDSKFQVLEHPSIKHAKKILSGLKETAEDKKLKSIFTFVKTSDNQNPSSYTFPLKPLDLDLTSTNESTTTELWNQFQQEYENISNGTGTFETFFALYRKYAWYISSCYEAISVYELFKATIALTYCIERDGTSESQLLLVGGDVPGIQNFLKTVTSKGALKGYKGRSFYIQLLTDLLSRFIIDRLEISSANIIYNAGGNFKLIAPIGSRPNLEKLCFEINEKILKLHNGELFAAIGWIQTDRTNMVSAEGFRDSLKNLETEIRMQKNSWFAELCQSDSLKEGAYEQLFLPYGKGGRREERCDVCHVDISRNYSNDDNVRKCAQCVSFEKLGEELRGKYLVVRPTEANNFDLEKGIDKLKWTEVLESFGYCYSFENELTEIESGTVYTVNDTNFLPESPVVNVKYDFRFIGRTTPTLSKREADFLNQLDETENARDGNVKDTTVMAKYNSTGIKRYGVLRMDIDSLGTIFQKRLRQGDMLRTSALSGMLTLFFEGWLNRICEQITSDWTEQLLALKLIDNEKVNSKSKLPYIIYSGGDDLFIIGVWDLLPLLAERIRHDLGSYVTRGNVQRNITTDNTVNPMNSHITISAGISVFHDKYPIYHAGEITKEALNERAKNIVRNKGEKDAIDFLDTTVGWEHFDDLKKLAFKLVRLIKLGDEDENEKVPNNFIQFLNFIANAYKENKEQNKDKNYQLTRTVYGSWMWKLVYGSVQLSKRIKSDKLKAEVLKIRRDLLNLNNKNKWDLISYLNLPVRWAEFLIKEGEQNGTQK